MSLSYSNYSLPLIFAAIVSAMLALFAWQRRSRTGATPFTFLMLALAVWSFAYALELEAVGRSTKVLWAKTQYFGIVAVPTMWLLMAVQFTGHNKWLRRRLLTPLAIVPSIMLLLAWTNERHGLIWREINYVTGDLSPALDLTYGFAFWGYAAYSYVMLLIGTIIMIRFLIRKSQIYRGQAAAMLIAACVPWLGNLLYLSNLSPFPNLDLTPFFFIISGFAMSFALLRYRLFDLVPIAQGAIIEGMNDGMFVLDELNRIVDLNPSALSMFTLEASGLIGQPISDVLADHPSIVDLILEPTEVTGEGTIENDNRLHHFDLRTNILLDRRKNATGKVVVLRNITEQKQVEAEVKESEERYRRLVELSPIAIAVHCDGKVVYGNAAALKLFGASSLEDIVGRPALDFIHPEYVEIVMERIRRSYEEGYHAELIEEKMVRLNGDVIDTEVAAEQIIYQGKPATQVVIRDITEKKKAEEALLETNSRLEETLAELKSTQEMLVQQERLAAVGQLAAGIAHDFNNALMPIIIYCEMLLDELELTPTNCRRLEMILNQAMHAADITQQILDFGRRSLMKLQPIEIVNFLTELKQLLKITLSEIIQINIENDTADYWIKADPARMKQVFINLASNAHDAMSDGGDFRIEVSRLHFESGERPPYRDMPPGEWVKVVTSDSGDGISEENLPHIFEPFFTTKGYGDGSGMGLAQVYGIIKQHRGYINVDSEVGKGTTFTIYIPALIESVKETPRATISERIEGDQEVILVVEDDTSTRHALCEILKMMNYRVLNTESSKTALELFKQEKVDLVLSDLIMPNIGGMALLKSLQEIDPEVKMIVITGYPLEGEGEALLDQGIMSWIQKPIDIGTITKVVWNALQTTKDENIVHSKV